MLSYFSQIFFNHLFLMIKFIPSQLYLFIKDLIFAILCGPIFVSSWFNMTVTEYWIYLLSFLLNIFTGYRVHCWFFVFYLIRRICIWSTTIWIYFMTFIIQLMNVISTFHWFQVKWIKKFFYNFICFITNHDFYVITFWMHYTLSIIIFRRNKVICYC